MTLGILICSGLTLLGIIILIIGIVKGYKGEGKQIVGTVILVLTGFIGWGVCNIECVSKKNIEKIDVEVVMTSKSAIVEYMYDDRLRQKVYENVAEYTMIRDYELEWTITTKYNQYSYESFGSLDYSVIEKKEKKEENKVKSNNLQ